MVPISVCMSVCLCLFVHVNGCVLHQWDAILNHYCLHSRWIKFGRDGEAMAVPVH